MNGGTDIPRRMRAISKAGRAVKTGEHARAYAGRPVPCCCVTCPFYYKMHRCNTVEPPCPVTPLEAFTCGENQFCNFTINPVVKIGDVCYLVSLDEKYVECAGGSPPTGFSCLPPNATILVPTSCHPITYCSDLNLCPPISVPPNAIIAIIACMCNGPPHGGNVIAQMSVAVYQLIISQYKCPYAVVIVNGVKVCGYPKPSLGCLPFNPNLPVVNSLREGGCCRCCAVELPIPKCQEAGTIVEHQGSAAGNGTSGTIFVSWRTVPCCCPVPPATTGSIQIAVEVVITNPFPTSVPGCSGGIMSRYRINGSLGAGGILTRVVDIDAGPGSGSVPDPNFYNCNRITTSQQCGPFVAPPGLCTLTDWLSFVSSSCPGILDLPTANCAVNGIEACRLPSPLPTPTGTAQLTMACLPNPLIRTTNGQCRRSCFDFNLNATDVWENNPAWPQKWSVSYSLGAGPGVCAEACKGPLIPGLPGPPPGGLIGGGSFR